jgi:alpha-L-fucosidase
MTICQQWAWKPDDEMKSLAQCLHTLILCAGGDGNLLFNVGPMPTGEIEPRQVERLKEMGAWLERYGESVYGTRGGPYRPTRSFATTRRGNTVYLHILRLTDDGLVLPPLPKRILGSTLVTGGTAEVQQTAESVTVRVPKESRQEIDTLVKLELDGPAVDIAPLRIPPPYTATASNVFQGMDTYHPDQAFDGDPGTRWATDGGTHEAWLAIDYGKPITFGRVRISEACGERVQCFEVQVRVGNEWKPVFGGTTIGEHFEEAFEPVTASQVRLCIYEATEGPTIYEFQLLPPE